MKNSIYIIGILFMVMACKKDPKSAIREIDILPFNVLTLDDRFTVILTQGNEDKIQVEGHPELIEKVSVTQDGNEIHILNESHSVWLRPKNNKVIVHITVKELTRINMNETSSISCTNELTGDEIGMILTGKYNEAALKLNCTTFYFWNNHPCGGKVNLEGQVDFLKIWNYAIMQVDASGLVSNGGLIENYSKGDVKSFIDQSLTYKIKGEGNIFLKGNPPNIESLGIEGEGQLIIE